MDLTCIDVADDVSCSAMISLAKDEYGKNLQSISYNLVNPACDRMNQLADRGIEHQLQKTKNAGLRECFTLPANYYDGPWTNQFDLRKPPYEVKFDNWTRPK